MGATIIEKIISAHAGNETVHPGDIVDVDIDARVARDFGGANVVKNLTVIQPEAIRNMLPINITVEDLPGKTV